MNIASDSDIIKFDIRFVKVTQPLGDFFVASIPAKRLVDITDFDVRRVITEDRDVEMYLGIQRPLDQKRVVSIKDYVRTADACFPTGVIVAVPERCVDIDFDNNIMTISNYINTDDDDQIVNYRHIARVLDGQHRLAGLKDFDGEFDINVSIFIDMDISDQATIFSTVNLFQTKVNKSLAYDLYDVMKTRSPQRTCHNMVVTLDRKINSPFYKKIKRLGVATPNRTNETLTQATVIEPILKMISSNPMKDRDIYLRNRTPAKLPKPDLKKHPLQHYFIDEKDFEITDLIWDYFNVVSDKWPLTWKSSDKGVMLNRTNGYRALMRYLNFILTTNFQLNYLPNYEEIKSIFDGIHISDENFNVNTFPPGSSGEGKLFRSLVAKTVVE